MKDLKEISTRLEIAKKNLKRSFSEKESSNVTSLGNALKISTELVVTVVVGAILGFILDSWFDTKPWLTIIFFIIGVAAGILNVFRSAKKMQKNLEKNKRMEK